MKRYILLHFLISIIITIVYGNNCDDTYNPEYNYGFQGDYGTNPSDEDYGGCFSNFLPGNQYDDCDDAILPIDSQFDTCEEIEALGGRVCYGCACTNDDAAWKSIWGCKDNGNREDSLYPGVPACNYDPDPEVTGHLREACVYPPPGYCSCDALDCGLGANRLWNGDEVDWENTEDDYCGDCASVLQALTTEGAPFPKTLDKCGDCDGDGPHVNPVTGLAFACDEIPPGFSFNVSNSYHSYFMGQVFDALGNTLDENDWIGVFNGTTCVGSIKWSQKVGDTLTDLLAMGVGGDINSEGYLLSGDIPTFKVYDWSELEIFEIFPYSVNNESVQFSEGGSSSFDSLLPENAEFSIELNEASNLISFNVLPTTATDVTIEAVLSDLAAEVISIISPPNAAIYKDGQWMGSLSYIPLSLERGYYIILQDPDVDVTLSGYGFNFDPLRKYDLIDGLTLISFPGSGDHDLSASISSDYENRITGIIGQASSTMWMNNEWVGSLSTLSSFKGYWIKAEEEINDFQFELGNSLGRSIHDTSIKKLPEGFKVVQSSMQAFYFIEDIKLDNNNIEVGDYLLSYNGDVLTGVREWNGKIVDIPAMGSDGYSHTTGYHTLGSKPNFKLLKQFTGEIIPLFADNINPWEQNGMFIINSLNELEKTPSQSILSEPYPNPFNPSTNFHFEIFNNTNVTLAIYDIQGRTIEILIDDEYMYTGLHSTFWNADGYPSGIYFAKLIIDQKIDMKKLMLLK